MLKQLLVIVETFALASGVTWVPVVIGAQASTPRDGAIAAAGISLGSCLLAYLRTPRSQR